MKKILLTLAMVFSLGFASATESSANLPEKVTFDKGNYFAITSQFNQKLLADFSEAVYNHSGDKMVIYFDTPGGSVIALSRMARIMKSSDIEFTCVANFAASAGFMLFQHCQHRILLSDGILMSHNWAGGFADEAPRILTLFNAIQSLVDNLEAVAIEKMTVNKREYAELINSNLWMPAGLATKYGAIDGVLDNVRCTRGLLRSKVFLGNYFGTSYYRSGCPLVDKLYTKRSRQSTYEEVRGMTTFQLAQKTYKEEMGNWIYKGSKNQFGK